MSMNLLGNFFREYFVEKQTPIEKQQEKAKEKQVFEPQFIHAEDVFSDVMPIVNSNEFYALSYIGGQGNGKTFSASEFATMAKQEEFLLIYGKAEDMLGNLQEWIDGVKQKIINHNDPKICFVLDDMSYSSNTISNKKAAEWKHFIGDIRHVFENVLGEGIKPKIFMIYISHRYHSVPPMLRTSASWIFASMLNEDRYDAQKLIPKNKDEMQRLDEIYQFLSDVTVLGPKYKALPFTDDNGECIFTWGSNENPGDGRLMMIFHSGHMRIFNPRKIDNIVDLEEYRIRCEPVIEEIKEAKEKIKQVNFEEKAKEPEKPNLDSKMRQIHCHLCGYDMKTKRKEGEMIQCSRCHKLIQKLDMRKILLDSLILKPNDMTSIIPIEDVIKFEKESFLK